MASLSNRTISRLLKANSLCTRRLQYFLRDQGLGTRLPPHFEGFVLGMFHSIAREAEYRMVAEWGVQARMLRQQMESMRLDDDWSAIGIDLALLLVSTRQVTDTTFIEELRPVHVKTEVIDVEEVYQEMELSESLLVSPTAPDPPVVQLPDQPVAPPAAPTITTPCSVNVGFRIPKRFVDAYFAGKSLIVIGNSITIKERAKKPTPGRPKGRKNRR